MRRHAATAHEWQTTFDGLADAVFVLDAAQRVQHCNRTALRLFRKPLSAVRGRHCWEIVHGTRGPISPCPFRRLRQSRHRESMELAIGDRWYHVVVDPLFDRRGELRGAVHVLRDITARKQAEAALRASEERYRLLADNTEDFVGLNDTTGHRLYVSPSFYRRTGWTPAEIERMDWRKRAHPDDLARIAQARAANLAGQATTVEHRVRCRDGSWIWVETHCKPLRDSAGKVHRLLTWSHDITERKQAEETLRQLNATLEQRVAERTATLRDSEERYRTLAEAAPDIIFVVDHTDRLRYVNHHAARYLGVPAAQAIGQPRHRFFPPATNREQRRKLRQVFATGQPLLAEELLTSRAGENIWLSTSLTPLRDAAGRVTAILGIARNITDRKHLEHQVLEISEREQRRIGQDLHDSLGQRLTGIAYLTETLKGTLARHPHPEADIAAKIGQNLHAALDQTKALARGLHPVEPEPEGLMAALKLLAVNVTQTYQVPCRLRCRRPVLLPDNKIATNLYRIAQEAARNAAVHAHPNQILIQLRQARGRIELAVQDDGCGLPQPLPNDKGLGLQIMQYRAGTIGACLNLASRPGRGTTVTCSVAAPGKPFKEPRHAD